MSSIATLVCGFVILGLFAIYHDPKSRTSPSLWIPTVWILLAGSRMVSLWFDNPADALQTASQVGEGSPLDRLILTGLLMLGILVLMCRARRVMKVLMMNWPLLAFFGYCALSTYWSATPQVAMKRWFKATGDLVMVLIILTDRNRGEAIKRVITRVAFILMPLSVLLIQFYPDIGRAYNPEDGEIANIGVTTNKNMLGVICLVAGLGCVWLFMKALREERRKNRQLLALVAALGTIAWLFAVANSITPLFCFLTGAALMVVVNLPGMQRPKNVHLAVGGMLSIAALIFMFPEIFTSIVQLFGRNSTLTGRTDLWKALIAMDTHPLFGTGFESFWLGNRLEQLWSMFPWQPNEAHNGYLEVYLNLGWVGVILLANLLVTGYRRLIDVYRRDPMAGSLRLAYFSAAAAYNFAEAGFRMLDPMWIFLLLAVIAVPDIASREEAEIRPEEPQELVPAGFPPDDEHAFARTS
ncbi:MAG: O-antigen ligase family protein [Acidobacteria bacterium]|nr:MAG: O-antigen ligase family protein [Acidobacteriota bacterium]